MKRRSLIIIGIIPAALFIGGGAYVYFTQFAPQAVMQTNSATNCRQGNVLANVDRPSRFTVLSTCEMAAGTVHDMKGTKEDDGDYEFTLDVDPQYKKLLNGQNDSHWGGRLVVEIIPADQNLPAVQIPKNGDRIEVDGVWVRDNLAFGWNEIHPTWIVKVLT